MKFKHRKNVIKLKWPSAMASYIKAFIVWLALRRIIPRQFAELLIHWLGLGHA